MSRILGFLSAVILARTVGLVGAGADAFALANQLPNNIYVIVAGGVLSAVLVPQIVKSGLHADGGAAYINRLVTLGMVVVFGVTVLATGLAPLLVRLYIQHDPTGSSGFDDSALALATAFAWWCLPQVFFYALYSLVGEVLNAKGLFGPFTWAPVVNNVIAIAGMLWFGSVFEGNVAVSTDWRTTDVALLAGTASLGVVGQAITVFAFLRRAGVRFRLDFRFRGVGLGTTTKLAAWTFGMLLVTQIAGLLQSNVASLATAASEPGLAVLRFGWLVFMLPHSVITVSLGTAYFTRMSTDIRDKRWDHVSSDIRESLSRTTFFMVISSAILGMTAPFVASVFAGNAETGMASVIALFALGLVPFGVSFIVQRILYALEDTRTPFFIQVAQSAVFALGLAIVSVGPTDEIANGIALWMSLSNVLHAIIIVIVIRRRLGSLGMRKVAVAISRFLIAVVPALGVGALLRDTVGMSAFDAVGALVWAGVIGLAMSVVYLGVLLLFRDASARSLIAPLTSPRNKHT